MRYDCKKAENCFEHSFTFEYRLPITAKELSKRLSGWAVAENHSYRRAILTADRDGVELKGILDGKLIRASFPENSWEKNKAAFESWLLSEEERDE